MLDGLSADYWVYYLSEDEQGGYWPVSPKGPYSLSEAREKAAKMRGRSCNRNVKVRLRIEVEMPV